MRSALSITLFSLMTAACSGPQPVPSDTPAKYQGTVERICSPVDATGLEIRLDKQAGSGPPTVLIQLWAPLPSMGPEPVELTGTDITGALMVCQSKRDCQLLERGYLIIETENTLGPASGLFWSSDSQLHGRFTANPIDAGNLICG